ncbi:hypothetical protein HDU83_003632 [Entophlyctis luteolus]|nr:hypothetical protein HDU83_003632 [Entophlyctis luteolus]
MTSPPPFEHTPLLRSVPASDAEDTRHRLRDVRVLGAAFFFLFAAQATIQSLASSVLPPAVAFDAAATLYVAFALFNLLLASAVVDRLGCRAGLVLAALTYTIHNCGNILALIYSGDPLTQRLILIPTALLNGLGAAVIWTSQGVYVAKCASPRTLGNYTGIFFGFMWSSGVVGPIFSSVLIQAQIDKLQVFEIVNLLSCVGVALLVYLWRFREEPSNPWAVSHAIPRQPTEPDTLPSYLKTLNLCFTPQMLGLMPLCYATGFEQAFYGASLPLFIRTGNSASDLSTKLNLRATLGAVMTLTGFGVGKLSDKYGSRPMIFVSALIHVLIVQFLLVFASPKNNLPVLIAVYAAMGVSSGILFTQGQKIVGTVFGPQSMSQAYSAYKFHTSVGTAASFFMSVYALDADAAPNMAIWAPIFVGLVVVANLGLTFVHRQQ